MRHPQIRLVQNMAFALALLKNMLNIKHIGQKQLRLSASDPLLRNKNLYGSPEAAHRPIEEEDLVPTLDDSTCSTRPLHGRFRSLTWSTLKQTTTAYRRCRKYFGRFDHVDSRDNPLRAKSRTAQQVSIEPGSEAG